MTWTPDRNALRGRVAVVAGATRGAGRGIATALGEAGATVVCTGRSTGSTRSEYDRPEAIEETAALVTRLGGTGIAATVDHLDPAQVKALAERIRRHPSPLPGEPRGRGPGDSVTWLPTVPSCSRRS